MRHIFCVAFCMILSQGYSQPFVADAPLPAIPEDGFYRILISPQEAVYSNTTFSNLRIVDRNSQEVPYLLEQEEPNHISKQFSEYHILEKKQEQGCCTDLTLHNPEQRLLNNISLVIKNADITKVAELLGSDDREHWFALKEKFSLSPSPAQNGTSEIKILDFPLSNYSYYSLRISDSTTAPLNILKAGYFEVLTSNGKYSSVPVQRASAVDGADKKTTVHIRFDTAQIIDKVKVVMKGTPYFLRKAGLYSREKSMDKKHKGYVYHFLQNVEITSKQPSVVELPGIKVRELILIIENEDSPPLALQSAEVFQLDRYLMAWLKKDETYKVNIAAESTKPPTYDLSFFRDSIPDETKVLSIGPVNSLLKSRAKGFTFFTTTSFVWVALIGVIGVLAVMCVRLLKEASADKNKDS